LSSFSSFPIYEKFYSKKKLVPFKNIITGIKENPDPDCLWRQLEVNGKFTWEEFEIESVGLLIGGFESISNTLCWILQYLTKFPSVKSKLRQEIDSTLHGKPPTPKDIDSLPYLQKFVLESLRYMEFFRMDSRWSVEQASLGEYQIPQGYSIFLSPGNLIRNSVENPDVFDPDRFNEENIKELSKIVLLTFGTGPRVCIGKYLTLLEINLMIVFLLQQNTDFEVDMTANFNIHSPLKSPSKKLIFKKNKVRNTV